LVDYSWKPKLTDIGICILDTTDGGNQDLKFLSGRGTPGYMAPEMYSDAPNPTTKSDVYSFAIVFWELISEEPPVSEEKTKEEIRDEIKQKIENDESPAPNFHNGFPESMKELLVPCFDIDPNSRPPITQFLEDQISTSEVKVYEDSEQKGLSLWNTFGDVREVSWDEFLPKFCTFLGLPLNAETVYTLEIECLKMILNAREPPNMVSHTLYKLFVLWFGPLSDKNGVEVLQYVKTLLQQEWFYGILSEDNANTKITSCGKPGCYLVRFSSKQACFTLSFLDLKKKKIKSVRYSPRQSIILISIIRATVKKEKLTKPVPGSPFQVLFVKQPALRSGYYRYDPDNKKKDKTKGKDKEKILEQNTPTTKPNLIYIP